MDTTLVLNVSYQPIACAPWQSAIVWVLERMAETVEEYPDRYIRTPNWQVNMPSIVRLLKPIRRKRAVKFSRQNVWLRDKGRCAYCGLRVARDDWTYDHVVPRAQGGETRWENVVVACTPCNQKKGGRTPEQARMGLRVNPVRPRSLPESVPGVEFRPGMPEPWREWLRSAVYWGAELEGEGGPTA